MVADAITAGLTPQAGSSPAELVLGLGGTINDLGLFADEKSTVRELEGALGTPDADTGWRSSNDCGPREIVERRIRWDNFEVFLIEGAPAVDVVAPSPTGQEPMRRYLAQWYYGGRPGAPDPLGLKTEEGVGLGVSQEFVEHAFPSARAIYDSPYSSYGGPVLEIFLGDAHNVEVELDSAGKVIAMSSGGTGCPE